MGGGRGRGGGKIENVLSFEPICYSVLIRFDHCIIVLRLSTIIRSLYSSCPSNYFDLLTSITADFHVLQNLIAIKSSLVQLLC